jgi:hypothetical protein
MESGLIDKNDDFVFFNKLNFYRGNAQLRMYSKDLSNVTHIKHEILRSMNIIQQYSQSVSQTYFNFYKMMTRYAFTQCSFEAFSMDTNQDV